MILYNNYVMENCIEAVRFPPWQIEILHCMQDNKQETSGPSNNNNNKKKTCL